MAKLKKKKDTNQSYTPSHVISVDSHALKMPEVGYNSDEKKNNTKEVEIETGECVTTPIGTPLNEVYQDNERLIMLLQVVVENFKESRDFFSLQLSYEKGIIEEPVFVEARDVYLSKFNSVSDEDLEENLKTLLTFIDSQLDGDEISGIFNCTEDKINQIFVKLQEQLSDEEDFS